MSSSNADYKIISPPKDIVRPTTYPYIEIACAFCPNLIFVPSDSYTSCVNCQNRICISCAPDIIKSYGNRFHMVSSMYCNQCYQCDTDYNDSDSDEEEDEEVEKLFFPDIYVSSESDEEKSED